MSKVFTVLSSIGNIGTTTTVLNIADTLSKSTSAKVGVLLLNAWDDGTDFFPEPTFTLDQIKSRLTGKMFQSEEDLLSKFTSVSSNLYILAGNRDRRLERLYNIDEVSYLIERATDIFDVVLIDAGCHVDNALTAGAIEFSDELFILLNQQAKSSKRFDQIYQDILIEYPLLKRDLHLIMNNYQNRSYLPTASDISKQVGLSLFATINHVENAWLCEIENKWSLLNQNKEYTENIHEIAKKLGEKANIPFTESVKKKRGLLRVFG